MSGEAKYTERDLILAKREGWLKRGRACNDPQASDVVLVYPLPKVERPRVVPDPHGDDALYRASRSAGNGKLRIQWRDKMQKVVHWRDWPQADPWGLLVTRERANIWADLLANPTELVDDDGASDPGVSS